MPKLLIYDILNEETIAGALFVIELSLYNECIYSRSVQGTQFSIAGLNELHSPFAQKILAQGDMRTSIPSDDLLQKIS